MFYRGYSILASQARPESLPSPRAAGAAKAPAEEAAQRALSRELGDMPLSRRLQDPAAYRRLQRARRQALEALIQAEPTEEGLCRAVDLIGMLCEESCWSENPGGVPFDDDAHPEIDLQCAETALLLGWTSRAFGERLSSRVAGKLLYEARRRVFAPFLAHTDYPFMRGRGPRPLTILSDILLTAILLEINESRRASVLKQALRLLDQAIAAREGRPEPLAEAAAETGAITDLAALLRRLTRGEVDLTPVYPTQDWLDQLLFPWLESAYFLDPAAGGMTPPLSGETLFRIGLAAGDDALTALGASLHRARPIPSDSLTGRLLDASCRSMLEAEANRPPRIKRAATAHNRLMVCRFGGMTFAMHTGGGRANAGGIALLSGGRPVLAEAEGLCSLPLIGGREQLQTPDLACEADYDPREEREAMSVELTAAWPAGLAHSCQRTAMIRRAETAVRLVDAFDLSESAAITFRFITPMKPEYRVGGLRLGDVDFSWEGDLKLNIAQLDQRFPDAGGDALFRIELSTPAPVQRAFFTFNFAKV